MSEHRLAVVLPALNEEDSIAACVGGFLGAGACCVFVVDGRSSDGTAEAASGARAHVVVEVRPGYGRACLTGARAAAAAHEWICFADADGSCDPADLGRLLTAAPAADLVLGRRVAPDPGSMPGHARLGNLAVCAYLWARSGRRIRDLPPLKLIRATALASLELDDPGYGWTVQLIGRALSRPDLRVAEVPASFRRRVGGESKVSGRLGPSLQAGLSMFGQAHRAGRRRGLLMLMAKAPRAGHSKTRLAQSLGSEATIAFWAACLADTASSLRGPAAAAALNLVAVVPSAEDARSVQAITGLSCAVQSGSGLGAALRFGFELAAARRLPFAMAVSADNPTLPADRIEAAAAALGRGQCVLGPTPDGGYYLIGLPLPVEPRRLHDLFAATPLGGGDVLRRTVAALGTPLLLEPWADVDTADELSLLAGELRQSPAAAPATAAWLQAFSGGEPEPKASASG